MRVSGTLYRALVVSLFVLCGSLVGAGCGPPTTTDAGSDTGVADTTDATADGTRADGGDADAGWSQKPVTEKGPFNPGYREITVEYQAKQDRNPDKRELNVSVWYPTTEEDGLTPSYYGLLDRENVIWKADPAPLESMPMLVFSHGNGGIAEQNYFQTEYWATHGWVVVSPDHTGNTLESGAEIKIEAAIYRPQDIRAVIDRMMSLESSDPLSGKISDTIVMSGHSFGGYTTLAVAGAKYAIDELEQKCMDGELNQEYCDTFSQKERKELFRKGFHDDRIDLAIPQAPAGARIFADGLSELKVPTMLMTGGLDKTLPNDQQGDPIWSFMKGQEHRRLHIPTAGHFTFTNMCGFLETVPDRIEEDGCGMMNIAPEKAHEIVNIYSLAFARHHFFSDGSAVEIVDGDRKPLDDSSYEYSVGAE